MSIFTYIPRVKKILSSRTAMVEFSKSEVVNAIVNLMDAQRNLSYSQYLLVSEVYRKYRSDKRKTYYTQREFLAMCNEIIGHFDLIAPYVIFCGNPKLKFMMITDEEKNEYRLRAMCILLTDALFCDDWMELHKEFTEKFNAFPELIYSSAF